jgi:nitrilase
MRSECLFQLASERREVRPAAVLSTNPLAVRSQVGRLFLVAFEGMDMMGTNTVVLGAIQAAPVYFDREASCAKACELILKAGRLGCDLAAFGETWLPGYPFHVYGPFDTDLWWEASALYLDQAVEVPSPTTDALCKAAAQAGIDVVVGIAERDASTQGSVYCTQLFISHSGELLGKHRKLKPTMHERLSWAEGDGTDLLVYQRPYGRLSGLNCWEHQMVLPGYVLMAQGTQFHVAAWPGDEWPKPPVPPKCLYSRQHLLARAFAAQGACYVISVAGLMTRRDIPERFAPLYFDILGDSVIIDPRGEIVAGPVHGSEEIIMTQASLSLVRAAKVATDVAGHYSRKDVFDLTVRGRSVWSMGGFPCGNGTPIGRAGAEPDQEERSQGPSPVS